MAFVRVATKECATAVQAEGDAAPVQVHKNVRIATETILMCKIAENAYAVDVMKQVGALCVAHLVKSTVNNAMAVALGLQYSRDATPVMGLGSTGSAPEGFQIATNAMDKEEGWQAIIGAAVVTEAEELHAVLAEGMGDAQLAGVQRGQRTVACAVETGILFEIAHHALKIRVNVQGVMDLEIASSVLAQENVSLSLI